MEKIWYQKNFGFRFVQILGIVAVGPHCECDNLMGRCLRCCWASGGTGEAYQYSSCSTNKAVSRSPGTLPQCSRLDFLHKLKEDFLPQLDQGFPAKFVIRSAVALGVLAFESLYVSFKRGNISVQPQIWLPCKLPFDSSSIVSEWI